MSGVRDEICLKILGDSVRNKAAWTSGALVWSLRPPCYSLWVSLWEAPCVFV